LNELQTYIESILESKNGYKLGEPWKFSKSAIGAIIPILRDTDEKRDYTTFPEVKDNVKFTDTGAVSDVKVKGIDIPLFIRSGTLLVGIAGQDRAVVHSTIVQPEKEIILDVRCVHASRPTSQGGGFKYGGYTPRTVLQSLHTGNQGSVWNSVSRYSLRMSSPMYSSRFGNIGSVQTQSIKHDNLPEVKEAMEKLDRNFQEILKEVPVLENQVGAIIVGMKGVIGIESFDHPKSWESQYKEAIGKYSDDLAGDSKLFTFDESQIMDTVNTFLKGIIEATIETINDGKTYAIRLEGYIGEFVVLNSHMVHLFVMESEDKNNNTTTKRPIVNQESRPVYRDRVIGVRTCFPHNEPREPIIFGKSQFDKLVTKGMKKGFKEMIDTIDEHNGEATWSDIYKGMQQRSNSSKTKISSSTVSQRLKEGKDIGLIGEAHRHTNGKKVYTLYKED